MHALVGGPRANATDPLSRRRIEAERLAVLAGCAWLMIASPATALAQPSRSEPTPVGPPGSRTVPLAPDIKPGAPVLDRAGANVGRVQSVAESASGGMNVIVKIDGKLVGLDASTLQVRGDHVASSQSKSEMLAAAGARP